jgi:hypothetical protein
MTLMTCLSAGCCTLFEAWVCWMHEQNDRTRDPIQLMCMVTLVPTLTWSAHFCSICHSHSKHTMTHNNNNKGFTELKCKQFHWWILYHINFVFQLTYQVRRTAKYSLQKRNRKRSSMQWRIIIGTRCTWMIYQSGVSYFSCKTIAGNYLDLGSCGTIEHYKKDCEVTERISVH